jgi:polysaccharide export outer membrane protein
MQRVTLRAVRRVSCLLTGSLLLVVASAAAQQLTPQQLQQLMQPQGGASDAGGDAAGADWAARDARGPLLDRKIDRAQYILGPGDQLILSVFGYRNQVFPLTVTPEGTVVVPTVGIVSVDGLSVEQAERAARSRVLRFYPNSEVELSLSGVRSFNLFVVGAVDDPGIRSATAVTRVSEVAPATSDGAILRSTRIRRGDRTLPIDLTRFLQTGDLRFNPFVREGDVLQIPIGDHTVTVAGEVPYPGTYEYLPNETLADVLRVANGGESFLTRSADTLFIMRFTNDPRGEIIEIPRHEAVGPRGEAMVLHPFDAIFVPTFSRYMQTTEAAIEGEVVRPGRFPIRPEISTVLDLIQMAGGFTHEASTTEILLKRERSIVTDSMSNPLTVVPPEMLTPNERRILQVTARNDANVSVIDVLSSPETLDLPLTEGDVLLVPQRREEIIVMGAVARPGLVIHRPGESIDRVVERAGGYVRRADRGDVVVLRSRAGTQLHRGEVHVVQPGDRIVVPFREHSTFLERVQTAQSVISTFSGLVLTIVGLERLWDAISN